MSVQVFVASALMEWHHDNSNVKVPKNIWELGAKRFMAEPAFVLAYIDFQLGLGDTANCRATFERGLTVTPTHQAKPLWDQYLRFESQVGLHVWGFIVCILVQDDSTPSLAHCCDRTVCRMLSQDITGLPPLQTLLLVWVHHVDCLEEKAASQCLVCIIGPLQTVSIATRVLLKSPP